MEQQQLREALEDADAAFLPDKWRLIHVKGYDLVADGFTKPLFGAAFQRFLENLGMSQPFLLPDNQEGEAAARLRSMRTREVTHSGVASALNFVLGYAVLSEAEALEGVGEKDDPGGNLCRQAGYDDDVLLTQKIARDLCGCS